MNLFPPRPVSLTYNEVPDVAPQPVMWKSLGHAAPGIEMHYGLETFRGELDLDTEADLRNELMTVGEIMSRNDALIEGMVLCREVKPKVIVRFIACTCGSNLWTTRN